MGASVQIWTHFGLHCSVGPKVPVELPQTLHKIIRHSDEQGFWDSQNAVRETAPGRKC